MRIEIDFSPFSSEEIENQPKIEPEEICEPIVPVPESALPVRFNHPEFGQPERVWPYIATGNRLVGYMACFEDAEQNKSYLPLTFCSAGNEESWRAYGLPRPYPLFNLPSLEDEGGYQYVLVVRGETNVEAAETLFPQCVSLCCPYGDAGILNADWTALKGQNVILAPHVDDRMEKFFDDIAENAFRAGAKSVRRLNLSEIAKSFWRNGTEFRRGMAPNKWDFAMALEEGWTPETIASRIGSFDDLPEDPKPLIYDRDGRPVFRIGPSGLEGLVEKEIRGSKWSYWEWVSDRLDLLAQSRTSDGLGWGKRFRFLSDDGKPVVVDLSAKDLAADGADLRRVLLDGGFNMGQSKDQRELLLKYVMSCKSSTRILDVGSVGWHGDVFVTANGIIGTHPSGEEVRYAGGGSSLVCMTGGSESQWQDKIARMAVGNSRLIFAVSAALSAPLLKHTGSEPGGFHFVGASSIGKTTLLHVAGSVWGGGRTNGYLNSWRATDNATEAVAAAHSDALLCLDEIGQANSKAVGALAYMLANGAGKSRMTRTIAVRDPLVWRTTFLSSGEVSLEAKIGEDQRSTAIAAGQAVRVVNIPADADAGFGLFENLHDYATAEEFSRVLKKCAMDNYGHLAQAFVVRIAQDVSGAQEATRHAMERFRTSLKIDPQADGQVKRVAAKFALVAAAGEIAIEWKLLPWAKGTADRAVKLIFEAWLADRGGTEAQEEMDAIAHIRHLILTQRETRFQQDSDLSNNRTVRDSLGFVLNQSGRVGRTFCFYAVAWQRDACKAMNPKLVAQALRKHGFLVTGNSRLTTLKRFSDKIYRVYEVRETLITETEPVVQLEFSSALAKSQNSEMREKAKKLL